MTKAQTPSREDIIRMAREAHRELVTKDYPGHLGQLDPWTMRLIDRFAALVAAHVRETEFKPDWNKYQQGMADGAAAEREACAKVCDEMYRRDGFAAVECEAADECAAAIRARKDNT